MKKYMLLLAIVLWSSASLMAADFGDLLSRLDSRDFSAEKDTALKNSGPYVGETLNPHSETVMFKARAEFLNLVLAANNAPDKAAEVNDFIVKAISSKVQTDTKVWLISQLTMTGTAKEVPALEQLLKNKEQMLVDAAAEALAKIPGPEATAVLEKNAAIPAVKSALHARNCPLPPLKPNETKMPLGLANASDEVVDQWMAGYDKLDEQGKVQTLASLTSRGDVKYRPVALAAIASDSPTLQKAGIIALEKLATKDDAKLLVAHLKDQHDLVVRICGFIVTDGFDDALLEQFKQTSDSKQFFDLATILVNRAVDVRSAIFAKTTAENCPDRLLLLSYVAKLATVEDVPQLVASVVRFPRGKEHDDAENLVAACCNKDATSLIQLLGKYPHDVIYPIMCRTGGDAAKKELVKGLESTDSKVLQIALRSLAQWPDASFADKMMEIATSNKYPDAMTLPVFRGYIRVVSLPDNKIGVEMTKDQKLDNLKKAFKLAKRADEKRLILSRLAANRTMNSFAFALECTAIPECAEAAYTAIVDHAHDTVLRNANREPVLKALNLVIEKSKDKKLIERANLYKGRM